MGFSLEVEILKEVREFLDRWWCRVHSRCRQGGNESKPVSQCPMQRPNTHRSVRLASSIGSSSKFSGKCSISGEAVAEAGRESFLLLGAAATVGVLPSLTSSPEASIGGPVASSDSVFVLLLIGGLVGSKRVND